MDFKPTFPRIIAIVLTALLSLTSLGAVAEDGTSGSLPEQLHLCEIVVAQWVPSATEPEVSADATPMASPVATPMASPAATPVASPAATPVDLPIVDSDLLTDDLQAATHAILDCMSDNNLEILLQITGEQFRGSWLGLGSDISDEDFSAFLPMMPNLPYELVGIETAQTDGDTASAIVTFTTGRQLMTSEWVYELVEIDGQNVWRVQQETFLPTDAPDSAAAIQIVINDGSFEINTASVPAGDIVINVTNVGENPHEVLIVRVPAGTGSGEFAAATNGIPDGGTFIGQVTVPAGTEGNIVLSDVRSGTYTIVDLLPGNSGLPNVSDGMITEFTVA